MGISVQAQQQVIGTYDQARQLIELHYFDNHFTQKKAKTTISISYLNGVLVENPYFSTGACQSMQLNRKGEQLYFFLTDRLPDVKISSWAACFAYDLKTKNITKLFSIPKQSHLIWRYIEGRKSVIYYDSYLGAFIEQYTDKKTSDTLARFPVSSRESWIEADSNHILFFGWKNGKILRWTYQFRNKKSEVSTLTSADHFCGTNGTSVLMIPPGSTQIHLMSGPFEQGIKTDIPWTCWLDRNYFCVTDEKYFIIYDIHFKKIAEYNAEQCILIGKAGDGVLAGKTEGNQRRVIWLGPGFGSEKKLNDLFSHTVYMITELP